MTHPSVARTEPRGMGRHGERDHSAGAQDPPRFAQRRDVVGHVLDHLTEHDCVEARVGEGKLGDIGSNHGSAHPPLQDVARRRRDIAADDVETAVLEQSRERPASGAGVEDRPARPSSEQQVEEEALSQFVPRAEEVVSVSPSTH
jgi:hypothetical protein